MSASAREPGNQAPNRDAILAPLRVVLPRFAKSATFKIGLAVVALTMVALPLVYLGFVGLTAYGLNWYVHAYAGLLDEGIWIALGGYIAPVVAGGILVLFMIKPLFAAKPPEMKPLEVTADDEPLLLDFVHGVARAVGAPPPARVVLNCEVNASAGFHREWLGLLSGKLVLTIGLPLIEALSLRQLAGVLAHEFGHFSQGIGMRLSFVIRLVNLWFARVVYERDVWDDRLVRWSHDWHIVFSIALWIARLFVFLSRAVLWILMQLGHVISCLLMRQMEYDADRYEIALAGTEAFEQSSRRIHVLTVCRHFADGDLEEFLTEARLADDLPLLVVAHEERLPKEVLEDIDRELTEGETSWLETHPATSARIAEARRMASKGHYLFEQRAAVILGDNRAWNRRATQAFYQVVLEAELPQVSIISTGEFLARRDALDAEVNGVRRYFQDLVSPLRPLHLPAPTPATAALGPDELIAGIRKARDAMLLGLDEHRGLVDAFDDIDDRLLGVRVARAYLNASFGINAEDYHLPLATTSAAHDELSRLEAKRQVLLDKLAPLTERLATRLEQALRLGQAELMASQTPLLETLAPAETTDEDAVELRTALAMLGELLPLLIDVRNEGNPLGALCSELGPAEDEDLHHEIRALMNTTYDALGHVQRCLANRPYPFDHGEGTISMRQHLLPKDVDRDDPISLLEGWETAVTRGFKLYFQVLGRLVVRAEAVETALGFDPLPQPSNAAEDP